MLVISRRIGESIVLGDNAAITATILDIQGNQVKLGVTADKSIPIDRAEIFLQKKAQKKQLLQEASET